MTRHLQRLLSVLPLLGLLAMGAGPVSVDRPEVGGTTGLLRPPLGNKLPPLSIASKVLASMKRPNGTGTFTANVGGHLLDVEATEGNHVGKLVVQPGLGQYRAYVQSDTGDASLTLIFLGHTGTWRLAAALVQVQGVSYTMAKGTAKISEPSPGTLTGTFSLVARRTDRMPGTIEVSKGHFSIAPVS